MGVINIVRLFSLFLAFLAYAANGAQAHIGMAHGETVSVLMCGMGSGDTYHTFTLGDDTPVESSENCCGDCMAAVALPADPPARELAPARFARTLPSPATLTIHPRSPLWPGAPPHGPPSSRKA
ncbi:MAG: hypothetical protein AAF829_08415 [Pseudomonadota bacterium]